MSGKNRIFLGHCCNVHTPKILYSHISYMIHSLHIERKRVDRWVTLSRNILTRLSCTKQTYHIEYVVLIAGKKVTIFFLILITGKKSLQSLFIGIYGHIHST